jgi:replicative DNA helicase
MPCYIRAAKMLGISVPDKIDQQRLEEILRKELKITDRSHEKMTEVIQKKLAEDPQELKKTLIQAIALAGKKGDGAKKDRSPPDRLKTLTEEGKRALARIIAESQDD